MKRFSKILVLLLTLALLVTAFAVVALADEEPTVPTPKEVKTDYQKYEDGATIQNGSVSGKTKKGAAYAVKQDDGNVYMLLTYEYGESGNAENIDTGVAKNYIATYPYTMISFDIMSPQGQHASDHFFLLRLYNDGTSVGYFSQGINFSTIGLSTTPYEWQHVSVVVEQDPTTLDFHQHVFVNGKFVKTVTDSSLSATIGKEGYNRSKLTINYMKFSASKTASEADKDTAIDNFRFSHFKSGATIEQMANYYYKDWKPLYKYTIGTIDGADGNVNYYDDFDKLLAAAGDTDVIKLKTDLTDVIINENAIIDTNIYQTNAETGEVSIVGNYNFDFLSTEGYVASVENGIYTIKKSAQLVTVNWDPECADDCDCFAEYGGHRLTSSSIVGIDAVPEFLGEIPTYDIVNGLEKKFVGWSYENDGTVDTLHAVTEEEIQLGTLNLYPVYVSVQYDFEMIVGGVSTYYMEEEFTNKINAAKSGSTFILHNDITIYHTIIVKTNGKTLTLDLNGFDINRHYVRVTKYDAVYDEATAAYVKSGDAIDTVYEGSDSDYIVKYSNGTVSYANCFIGINASSVKFNLKSSRPGANIYAVSTAVDRLYSNGAEVATERIQYLDGLALLYMTPASGLTFNFDAKNITCFSSTIFSAEHGSNSFTSTLNIDGGTFYAVGNVTEGVFAVRNGETINVSDATFYANGKQFIRNAGSNRNKNTIYNFDNCNIYDATINSIWENDVITFKNCSLANIAYWNSSTMILDAGTVASYVDAKVSAGSGCVIIPTDAGSYSYTKLSVVNFSYDENSGKFAPIIVYANAPTTGNYTYQVKKAGEVETRINDAMFSLTYYSNFELVLYIPADVNVTYALHFTEAEGTVNIDGEAYRVFKAPISTIGVGSARAKNATLTFVIDGVEYKQGYDLSALLYAELVLPYSDNNIEKTAVANMLRYIAESYTASEYPVPQKLSDAQTLYPLDAYKNKAEYDNLGADGSGLTGVSMSIILNGANAGYRITLPNATFGVEKDAVVTISLKNGESLNLTRGSGDSKTYYWYVSTPVRIYDLIENVIDISITLSTGETLTGSYSVGAYIQGTDNDLAKAMYEFGVAARAYRTYLEQL